MLKEKKRTKQQARGAISQKAPSLSFLSFSPDVLFFPGGGEKKVQTTFVSLFAAARRREKKGERKWFFSTQRTTHEKFVLVSGSFVPNARLPLDWTDRRKKESELIICKSLVVKKGSSLERGQRKKNSHKHGRVSSLFSYPGIEHTREFGSTTRSSSSSFIRGRGGSLELVARPT